MMTRLKAMPDDTQLMNAASQLNDGDTVHISIRKTSGELHATATGHRSHTPEVYSPTYSARDIDEEGNDGLTTAYAIAFLIVGIMAVLMWVFDTVKSTAIELANAGGLAVALSIVIAAAAAYFIYQFLKLCGIAGKR